MKLRLILISQMGILLMFIVYGLPFYYIFFHHALFIETLPFLETALVVVVFFYFGQEGIANSRLFLMCHFCFKHLLVYMCSSTAAVVRASFLVISLFFSPFDKA